MNIPHQVLDFLASAAPFHVLDNQQREQLAQKVTVLYLTKDNQHALLQDAQHSVFLVNRGQFTVKDSPAEARGISEGDFFAYQPLIGQAAHEIEIQIQSPGLVYSWPHALIKPLVEQHKEIADFFNSHQYTDIASQAISSAKNMWLYKRLSQQLSGKVISSHTDISVQQAARLMADNKVSCLMLTDQHTLTGIVTDRDLRTRVVAQGLDLTTPVDSIMTPRPIHIDQHHTLFDALSLMTEHNIHHLPVTAQGKPAGIVTASDIVRQQRGNTLFIISELSKADSLYQLSRLAWQLPHYFASYASRLGDFDIAGKVLAQATDIMTRRLIHFFTDKHGEPPMPFCWLVYGSQARQDQTMGSDQDNGLLLAEQPTDQQAEYFRLMGEYVCQGLGKCGIKLCTGNIMASNPALRLSLNDAIDEAKKWVATPSPDAILKFNIYLDVRPVAGDLWLFDKLQQARRPLFQQQQFLAALARQANSESVPLSVFQRFTFAKNSKDKIDLKVNAVAIINSLVRLYALESGLRECSTPQRLQQLPKSSGLVQKDANNLRDIWLMLNRLRWRHQVQQQCTDNLVSITELSSIQRHQLKAAFKAIKAAQAAAVVKFSGGMG